MSDRQFVTVLNDEDGKMTRVIDMVRGCRRGKFYLCVGASGSSDVPGISAAGATPELRRLTPAIDAEALVSGKTMTSKCIPVSPKGIVSPVVVTRGCMTLAGSSVTVVDCGTFAEPQIECLPAGRKPARCVSTGQALELAEVEELFLSGIKTGDSLPDDCEYVVIAECVPAGTTTAMAVLMGLGYAADNLVSSSLPKWSNETRHELIRKGLAVVAPKREQLAAEEGADRNRWAGLPPLEIVAAVGDPMQPFAAGLAIAAARFVPVILGGGSQMLAVYAIAKAISQRHGAFKSFVDDPVGVITTKWVAFDPSADTQSLSRLVKAPFACSCPDFRQSRHKGLQSYEDGNVKEGTGAGAALALAHLIAAADDEAIISAIDSCYDELVQGVPSGAACG